MEAKTDAGDAFLKEVLGRLGSLEHIRPEEIPNIDLYMDQVLTFMEEHLQSMKRYPDDKMLTKTMINNYTKNKLLPPPEKKKYSKEHMLLMIFIYYYKNVLSVTDTGKILETLKENFFHREDTGGPDLEEIYRKLFSYSGELMDSVTGDVMEKYALSRSSFDEYASFSEAEKEYLTDFLFACELSLDIYMKKTILEHMIDSGVLKIRKDASAPGKEKA